MLRHSKNEDSSEHSFDRIKIFSCFQSLSNTILYILLSHFFLSSGERLRSARTMPLERVCHDQRNGWNVFQNRRSEVHLDSL